MKDMWSDRRLVTAVPDITLPLEYQIARAVTNVNLLLKARKGLSKNRYEQDAMSTVAARAIMYFAAKRGMELYVTGNRPARAFGKT